MVSSIGGTDATTEEENQEIAINTHEQDFEDYQHLWHSGQIVLGASFSVNLEMYMISPGKMVEISGLQEPTNCDERF